MIDPHNLDYFLEQDTNPSLFQEKEDLENCFHHPQSFEIGTSSSLHTYIHTCTHTTTACATTRTEDHQHRPETTTTGGETSQVSYQENLWPVVRQGTCKGTSKILYKSHRMVAGKVSFFLFYKALRKKTVFLHYVCNITCTHIFMTYIDSHVHVCTHTCTPNILKIIS